MPRTATLRRPRSRAAILLANLATAAAAIAAVKIVLHRHTLGAETWNGLTVFPEHRSVHL